jgi:transcriptional regulator with XRE-family HTH domain
MAPVKNLDPDNNMWHWIAVELRFWREKGGLSLSQMGRIMGCTKATVSNFEHGLPNHRMGSHHAEALDQHFDLGDHFQRLVRYARSGHHPEWFKAHVLYEQKASVIRTYEAQVIPGLLQTPDYARALLVAGKGKDVEGSLERRMARQAVLTKDDAPHFWVIMSQTAIDWPVLESPAMKGQLQKLLEVSALPNVIMRILPMSVGPTIGLDGSFKVITLAEGDVVYMEACGGGRTSRDPAEIAERRGRFDQIGADSLSRSQSRDLILKKMEAY